MTAISIRPCTAADADAIGRLAGEFQEYLRTQGSEVEYAWDARTYLRDGFGEDPAFEGVVVEVDSAVVGYALYHFGYDTDRGERYLYLIDLFVSAPFRRKGIGEAMMARLGAIGRGRGAELMAWSVLQGNVGAMRFYEGLGGRYVEDQVHMWRPLAAGA